MLCVDFVGKIKEGCQRKCQKNLYFLLPSLISYMKLQNTERLINFSHVHCYYSFRMLQKVVNNHYLIIQLPKNGINLTKTYHNATMYFNPGNIVVHRY